MLQEQDEALSARKRLPRLQLNGGETHNHDHGYTGSPSLRDDRGILSPSNVPASTSAANGDAVLSRRVNGTGGAGGAGGTGPAAPASPTHGAQASFASPVSTIGQRKQDHEKLLKPQVELATGKLTMHGKKMIETSNISDITEVLSDTNDQSSNNGSDICDEKISQLQQLRRWIRHVRRTFGTSFLLVVCAVYASQGFNSFSALAINYFFKDHLKLQPAESQALMTVMMFPWGIKPVYGIISDSLPFFKYHRKSYMILFSSLGTIGYLVLSIPHFIDTPATAVSVLFVNSLSASVIDVVIDARVVEMSRLDPKRGANDLQSVSWTAMAIGGVLGSFLSGPATEYLGVRGVFFFASLGPIVVLSFSLAMKETKSRVSARNFVASAKRQFRQLRRAVMTPVIWKCALWVFLSGSVSPSYSQVFFYFSTDVLKFTPEFLGFVSALGFVFLLLGTLLYNAFFKDVSFRRIFLLAQLSLAAVSLLDVILVTRANLSLGIPDKAFVLGDAVIADVVSRLKTMPVLVLCAKLCPKGVEGTLFALLMSISNFSFSISEFWGAFICHSLGIKKDFYDDLWIAIVARSALKLTPILFLFLIPSTDPQEIVDQLNFESASDELEDSRASENDGGEDDDEEEDDEQGTPNGVIRADHTVRGSPDATPTSTPRKARREIDEAV